MFDKRFREMLMMDYATKNQNTGVLSNQQPNSGLLSNNTGFNLNPNILLGANIFGAGLEGKNPFSAFSDAALKTAQFQKIMAPKKGFRQLTNAEKEARGLPLDKEFQIETSTKKVSQIGGSGTNVTVNNPQETQEQKEIGKVFAEEFKNINESGNAAIINDQKINTMLELTQMENLNTGAFGPIRTEVQKFAEEFGFDPGLQDTTIAEVVQGVSGGMVLDGLQKFKGAISDGERKFTQSITAGLSMTKEGNKILLDISKRQNQLAKAFSEEANKWVSENGGLSKKNSKGMSWGEYKAAWHKANPLINPEMKNELTALSKTIDTDFNETIIDRNGKKFVYINGQYHRLN